MDFSLIIDNQTGAADMSFDQCTDLLNNIYLSLTIIKGTWFHRRDFGIVRRERMKNTEQTARLIRQDCLEALQWLLDTGRAASIDVAVERDRSQDLNRLKLAVQVQQADGRVITFTTFREVV
jgi:phage gp46-like protein